MNRGVLVSVLSSGDAELYRLIFDAQETGNWDVADEALADLKDRGLLGHVLADRYQRRGASAEELVAWLEKYIDYPEAETIYGLARQQNSSKKVPQPLPASSAKVVLGGAGGSSSFAVEIKVSRGPLDAGTKKLALAIDQALRQNKPARARDLLVAAHMKQPLVGVFAADAAAAVAAGLFFAGESEQAWSLAKAAAGAQHPLGLWVHGLIAWEREDFASAASSFTQLAGHSALDAEARAAVHFWAYRSLSAAGNLKDARRELERAAQQPYHFYGFLAAHLLGRKASLPNTTHAVSSIVWNDNHRSVLESYPAGWRALALIQIGHKQLAQDELLRLDTQGRPNLRHAMMSLAKIVPMPDLAAQLAAAADLQDQGSTAKRYPFMPWQPHNGFKVDKALIYALARHESRFDPTAVSSKGALGLMQLMPKTASTMAENVDEARLFDPSYNLALGQKYVRHLATNYPKIGDNLLFLLAAYNGGPNKIIRWVESGEGRYGDDMDPLLFIESIPIKETRNYVMQVMAHYWGYQMRLNAPLATLEQLSQGKWPRISLAQPAPAVLKVASN